MGKEYIVGKAQCERSHKGLVCSGCGKPIVAIETVDNASRPTYWSGCILCNRFQHGISVKVWKAVDECIKQYTHLSACERQLKCRQYAEIFTAVLYYYGEGV